MKTEYRHNCPCCNEGEFSYIVGVHQDTEYQWVCDSCGAQVRVSFSDNGKTMKGKPTGKRCEQVLCLIEIDGTDITFAQKQVHWVTPGESRGEVFESLRYHIEEYTCPSNVLSCKEVWKQDYRDPHGNSAGEKIFTLLSYAFLTGPDAMDVDEVMQKWSELLDGLEWKK